MLPSVVRFQVCLLFVFLALPPTLLSQSDGACEEVRLPLKAQLLIEKKFPEWHPKDLSDLIEDDRTLWLQVHPKECPGIALGHFERPDRVAYAILLVPKLEHSAGYKLIVLSNVSDEYAVRSLDQAEGVTAGCFEFGYFERAARNLL